MAFDHAGLRRIAHGGTLGGANTSPAAIFHYIRGDTLAAMLAAQYFDTAYQRLAAKDTILLIGSDGQALAKVTASSVSGVTVAADALAGALRIARGAAEVTGTLAVTSGLATVLSVTASLATDPAHGTAMWTSVAIPAQVDADAGKFTLKTWKPTATGDVTAIAGTGTPVVSWIAIGT